MAAVPLISGSAAARGRTVTLLEHAEAQLAACGHTTTMLSLLTLPARALLHLQSGDPRMVDWICRVQEADALVLATPVHNNSYSALLKAWLDTLPRRALAHRAMLALKTGRSPDAARRVDDALRPVLEALAARRIVPGCFVLDSMMPRTADGECELGYPAHTELACAVRALCAGLDREPGRRAISARMRAG